MKLDKIQSKVLSRYTKEEIDKALTFYDKSLVTNPWYVLNFPPIIGEAISQSRPRSTVINKKVVVYDSPKIRNWKIELKKLVNFCLEDDYIVTAGEVIINVIIFRSMPLSFSKTKKILCELRKIRPTKKPDTDNYSKSIFDALKSTVWKDDSQIVTEIVKKFYSEKPRIEISIKYKEKKMD